ncbi:unnamed protein product [Protopolystoma xenopodis]|uniref:Uncharacterized protein n=1 Tax=Protopolystoma xenopodis TaxID=117903 RepID=A0A448WKC2_9PLAT|nr:unnamed protein product [Protopolystoma xenopodis]
MTWIFFILIKTRIDVTKCKTHVQGHYTFYFILFFQQKSPYLKLRFAYLEHTDPISVNHSTPGRHFCAGEHFPLANSRVFLQTHIGIVCQRVIIVSDLRAGLAAPMLIWLSNSINVLQNSPSLPHTISHINTQRNDRPVCLFQGMATHFNCEADSLEITEEDLNLGTEAFAEAELRAKLRSGIRPQRICPCRDGLPGQTSLCNDCL